MWAAQRGLGSGQGSKAGSLWGNKGSWAATTSLALGGADLTQACRGKLWNLQREGSSVHLGTRLYLWWLSYFTSLWHVHEDGAPSIFTPTFVKYCRRPTSSNQRKLSLKLMISYYQKWSFSQWELNLTCLGEEERTKRRRKSKERKQNKK